MALDLSVLDDAPVVTPPGNQVGVVLALRLDEVEEDPDQPRHQFDEVSLAQLADVIRKRRVQVPIIVRPKVSGRYRIIHGARRYRASKLAGKPTIPAIVESDAHVFDDYAQVLENLQRVDLNALEIAQFVQKRQRAGDSNSMIAQQLGVRREFVTWHLALVDAAAPVLAAFHEGRIEGAQQVYRLNTLYEKAPLQVEALLANPGEITRRQIVELIAAITGGASPADANEVASPATRGPASGTPKTGAAQRSDGPAARPTHAASAGSVPRGSALSIVPERMLSPLLMAKHGARHVTVELFMRPRSPGMVFVSYENGCRDEVELARLHDLLLTEGEM